MNIGSGARGELTFLDIIAILSFLLGVLNLDENLTQSDKQDIQDGLNGKIDAVLDNIHAHLQEQDAKLDLLIERIERKHNEAD